MIEEMKMVVEMVGGLGDDAISAFKWWVAYRFAVALGWMILLGVGLVLCRSMIRFILSSLTLGAAVASAYSAVPYYVSSSQHSKIMERVNADVRENGDLNGYNLK